MSQDKEDRKTTSKTSVTRRTVLSGAAAVGLSTMARAQSPGRGQGRPDRAAVRHLYPSGPVMREGAEMGGRSHQCARRRQVARRRQAQAGRPRFRRHHRESQERGAAHGRAGDRSGGGDRRLSEFVHARGHRSHGAGQSAGSHPLLFRSDHRSRLQICLPDLRDRRIAGETSSAADREAGGNRFRQEAQDGRDHHRQHRRVGRVGKGDARGSARRERAATDRRRNLYAAAHRRHLAGSEGPLGETRPAVLPADRDFRRQAVARENERVRPRTRQDSDRLVRHRHRRTRHAADRQRRNCCRACSPASQAGAPRVTRR